MLRGPITTHLRPPMLNLSDFEKAATQVSVPVANVRAVCEVEAPGGGFDDENRPRILFEAHRFSKLTGGIYDKSHPKISSPSWNRALYATGKDANARNKGEHERLTAACMLNRNAALMSTSWGRFQILGENFGACGFDTLQDFINAMYKDEPAQLDAFVEYIKNDKRKHDRTKLTMEQALRVADWASFARLYNGPAYAENQYDVKLAAAAKKYA